MTVETAQRLLIVDDDEALQQQLRWAFDGFDIRLASNRQTAVAEFEDNPTPVVLLDLGLPPDQDGPSEGLATLESILAIAPETKVVMMTGQTNREYAVRAISLGAYDFYEKPIEADELTLIVERAQNLSALESENRRLQTHNSIESLPDVIAASPNMLKVCRDVRNFATTDISALIIGESGTGKELIARALHQLSNRADGPLVAINCAAIPEALLESELFGHEKGAFTGALKTTEGRVEQANGGTLFLDEIGDMPLPLQAKLLRFLEQRTIERVGGRREIPVDVRIISATNQDLATAHQNGAFREDLYYRLAETVFDIPPLRDREEDCLSIARHVLDMQAKAQAKKVQGFTKDALGAILAYPWPGNVRELQNRVKHAVVSAEERFVTAADLALDVADQPTAKCPTLKQSRELAERTTITRALNEANGNVTKAARILDISRPTLYQMLRQFDLKY